MDNDFIGLEKATPYSGVAYSIWSFSDGIYIRTSSTRQFRIRHRSLMVVVFSGLFFRSLSMVELEIWYFLISV